MSRRGRRRKTGNKLADLCVDMLAHIHQPNILVEKICRHFNIRSAVLWLKNPLSHDSFRATAHYNRIDIETRNKPLSFRLSERHIVAQKAFERGRAIFGEIGIAPFSGEWLDKPYTKYLLDENIRRIGLFPIFTDNNKPFAILSFYGQELFAQQMIERDMMVISKIIYFGYLNVHNRILDLTTEHRKMGHEVSASLKNLKSSVSKLRVSLGGASSGAGDQETFDDIKKAIDSIQVSAEQERVARSIREFQTRATSFSLVSEYNSAVQPIIRKEALNRITLSPLRGVRGIYIIMYQAHFRQIIDNLMTNAIKYSPFGGVIRAYLDIDDKSESLIMKLSNTSAGIPIEERSMLWDANFRGEKALESNIPGEGLGLNIVREICEAYDIKYGYAEEKGGSHLIWSTFWLKFPSHIVDWEKS